MQTSLGAALARLCPVAAPRFAANLPWHPTGRKGKLTAAGRDIRMPSAGAAPPPEPAELGE
jgi:hypothetical protein